MRSPQTKLLSLDRSAPELRGHQSTISSQIQTAATDMQSSSEKYHMMPLLHNDAPSANSPWRIHVMNWFSEPTIDAASTLPEHGSSSCDISIPGGNACPRSSSHIATRVGGWWPASPTSTTCSPPPRAQTWRLRSSRVGRGRKSCSCGRNPKTASCHGRSTRRLLSD